MSSGAYLFYGFAFHTRSQREGGAPPAVFSPLMEEYDDVCDAPVDILTDLGHIRPHPECPGVYSSVSDAVRNEYMEKVYRPWAAEKDAALNHCSVVVTGNDYERFYYLAVQESVLSAWSDGKDHLLPPDALQIGSDWNERLRDLCYRVGITFGTPTWVLAASS